jgi:hypothetical protein
VQKLDITMLTRAADELLERVENPRHRREFITLAEAREKLDPLIRPLPD